MDVMTHEERRTLLAEQDLLERVADLAALPGRLSRSDLDDALRAVDLPGGPDIRLDHSLPRPRVCSEV